MAFDDDETLLGPSAFRGDDDGPAVQDALKDGVPDYGLFASVFDKKGVSGKTIRKGEKDFESHGTRAQGSALEASRKALEDVLSYTRTHRPDAWIRGWYFPGHWPEHLAEDHDQEVWLRDRAVVLEHEKGSWMKDIGRTASGNRDEPGAGRLWLLPEEALYLVERGTLDLWWPDMSLRELLPRGEGTVGKDFGPDDYDAGLPLSLEAAYSLLIGHDGEPAKTSLPKYQVYAHLKRAGFHVLRAPPESRRVQDPRPPPCSLWQWLFSLVSWERQQQQDRQSPWGPLVAPGIYRAYGPIYQRLALLPRHKPVPIPAASQIPREPFRVHYHVWKPGGGVPFSKKNPPPPDFRIAVADADESSPPTLEQIEALLESTPFDPPGEAMQRPWRLYQRLKHGHRNVLVAVVDRGLVNFMRFGEAAFGEEKLFERFDARSGRGRGANKSGRGGGRARGGGRGRGASSRRG